MKKLLILGAKGMLGQELVGTFSDSGYTVLGTDRGELDILDTEQCTEYLDTNAPDIVINSAAHNGVDDIETSVEVFELAKKLNGTAPGMLAALCKERNIVFVHFSSDYVFDGIQKDGYSEDAVIANSVNKYGETKLLGETLVAEAGGMYYIVRLSRLFGKPGASEGSKKSFVDTMRWLATEGGKTELSVVDEEVSCPSYAPDVAQFTRELVEQNPASGIYHGANDGSCTWYDLACKTFEILGLSVDVSPVTGDAFSRPAQRPAYSVLVNSKMPVQRGWEDALREYLVG
jgi:dTDP-4-dehydrorhamnose reductase